MLKLNILQVFSWNSIGIVQIYETRLTKMYIICVFLNYQSFHIPSKKPDFCKKYPNFEPNLLLIFSLTDNESQKLIKV